MMRHSDEMRIMVRLNIFIKGRLSGSTNMTCLDCNFNNRFLHIAAVRNTAFRFVRFFR